MYSNDENVSIISSFPHGSAFGQWSPTWGPPGGSREATGKWREDEKDACVAEANTVCGAIAWTSLGTGTLMYPF